MVAVTFVAGCGANDAHLNERIAVWETKVAAEVPPGTSRADLNRWASANGIAQAAVGAREVSGVVETLSADGLVCSKWHILVAVSVDGSDRVASAKVSKAGTCL